MSSPSLTETSIRPEPELDLFPDGAPQRPYDEVLAADGSIRTHWQALLSSLHSLGPDELADRIENSRRIIREQGVTCPAPTEASGTERPWDLDVLPMTLPPGEWRTLEAGLAQRARLLNAVLQDLYGYQRSLRNGWLPAPLVYANPHYLRGCQAVRVPGGNYLPFYAADLGRSPDGRWWVLADRTQLPSGLGFVLENRAVLSRVLPEAIQQATPRFIGGMLPLIRETLIALAPQNKENPTVVVLTPGQHHEAYFEHTYIARMLGFTLVEGGDLTVRDRKLFIKTLEGLRPVDVVLRRVNDAFSDPLEFRADSLLGVPGLLEVARAGHVAIANALGCGLVESPALMAFLPNLCRHLLGEELQLPSVATWWCGQTQECDYVQNHLDELAFRSAFYLSANRDGGSLRQEIAIKALAAQPHNFVGQEQVILSRTHTLLNGKASSSPFILRAFVVANGKTVHVMPGGLVRLVKQPRQASTSFSLAGGSKDLWIPQEAQPASEPSREIAAPAPFVERAPLDLPSRTADNLFWLGRYTERLEYVLRITRCVIGYLTEDFGASSQRRLSALATMISSVGLETPSDSDANLRDSIATTLLDLIESPDCASGVRQLIYRIHSSAFAVRDRLSADTWRILKRLEEDSRPNSQHLSLLAASAVLDTLILDLAAFNGMEMENMTRGHGWLFLDSGRRLERSINLVNLFESLLNSGGAVDLLLEPLLNICDSLITYRQRHFAEMRLPGVLNLLMLEENNPRSLAFQLAALKRNADILPEEPQPEGVLKIRHRISAVAGRLHFIEIEELEQTTLMQETTASASRIFGLMEKLVEISDLLTQVYFSHVVLNVN